MSRRTAREIEQLPHHVYVHLNADGDVIYVGMTVNPDVRPTDAKQRLWMRAESTRVEISPPMPYDAAIFTERLMIRAINPKHNKNAGSLRLEPLDWRIDRICESEGVTRTTAKWSVRYMPKDPAEFEALLTQRRAALSRNP